MDSTEKIILSESLNKSSKNENMSLNISLSGNKKLLPDDGVETKLDLYDLYVNERKESNKFRIIVNINPYCSNVLFNPFTEIVKYSGDTIELLNYSTGSTINNDGIIGKTSSFTWTAYDAIRDTQLSNDNCGYTYYCGLDIFNNHILRNKTFKSINYSNKSSTSFAKYSEVYGNQGYKDRYIQGSGTTAHPYLIDTDFNTIDDYLRDKNGIIVSDYILTFVPYRPHMIAVGSIEANIPFHLYQSTDVLTFEESYDNNLIEKNGWFGFYNSANLATLLLDDDTGSTTSASASFSIAPNKISVSCDESGEYSTRLNIGVDYSEYEDQNSSTLSINKVINNRKYGDFIDMYPTRELFSFTPLYNENQKRYEKNWNYCLTYPSESITKDFNEEEFPFFKRLSDNTISLKAITYDEYVVDDDGRDLLTIYSICEHGLQKGDNVNIYKNDELFYNNGVVANVVDKYIFQIYKDSADMSNMWINVDEVFSGTSVADIHDDRYNTSLVTSGKYVQYHIEEKDIESSAITNVYEGVSVITASRRCNIDPTAQDVSFKRVVNDVECEYYVRVFSRLPNFKFADAEINDYNLYEDKDLELIDRYSDPSSAISNFENSISDTSFADTAYGDNTTQIVFTDDIDTSYLKDNLGRPLSEIYLTIVKNNKGFRKWYTNNFNNVSEIEYSHCFGYISSSFLYNDYYRDLKDDKTKNGKTRHYDARDIHAGKNFGLKYHGISNKKYTIDEIDFNTTRKYYGDIVCYSPVECDETSLQSVMARFNTVQREISNYSNMYDTQDDNTTSYEWRNSFFNNIIKEDLGKTGVLFHDEIIDDEINSVENITDASTMWEKFNDETSTNKLYHSSFHLASGDTKDKYKYTGMTNLNEGYYYKMHYKIPLKTISSTLNSDNGINYELFNISKIGETDLLIKTTKENDLSLNDKLILYDKVDNRFYYLTVSEIYTKFYFKCSVKNEDLKAGFSGSVKDIEAYSLNKKSLGTPDYAKIIKDGSCRYYWRNIISNGIEENDSKVYPFTNGAFYVNRSINFFLRRQDPEKENLAIVEEGSFDYVPEGEKLPLSFYDDQYYDSEEIEVC